MISQPTSDKLYDCKHCPDKHSWESFTFPKDKKTKQLYRSNTCRTCTTKMTRCRAARHSVTHTLTEDDLQLALDMLDRASADVN